MKEPQALYDTILDRCLKTNLGEHVWINAWDHTLNLASELAWECRKRGCEVFLTVQPEDLWLRTIMEASIESLDNLPANLTAALEETSIYIFTMGPRNPIPWEKIPTERRKSVSVWLDTRYDKSKFAEQWAKIAGTRKIRMLAVEATLATPERARALGLNYEEWKQVMFEGCTADPRAMASLGRTLEPLMEGIGEVHVTTPSGTDLKFKLANRPLNYSYGQATEEKAERAEVVFLPAGGIEVSGAEESAGGSIVYDCPTRSGKGLVKDLTLQISNGRVKQFSAKSGREIFEQYLGEGTGDEDRFALFGFGLNSKLRNGFTQDDKVLGSTVIGFGENSSKAGKNVASGGWWAAMTKATVTIGGRTVMQEGKLGVKLDD